MNFESSISERDRRETVSYRTDAQLNPFKTLYFFKKKKIKSTATKKLVLAVQVRQNTTDSYIDSQTDTHFCTAPLWSQFELQSVSLTQEGLYIYIYAFSRCFYPKRLTVHSGYTVFVSKCVPWESNPQPLRC